MIPDNSAAVYRQPLHRTFSTAFKGIIYFFKTERNGKVQAVVAACTLFTAMYLQLSFTEWMLILFCIAGVISLEMVNAALEHLCNHVHKEYHPSIKIIKDIAAGAVLFFSAISIIAGLIIFIPKILPLL